MLEALPLTLMAGLGGSSTPALVLMLTPTPLSPSAQKR